MGPTSLIGPAPHERFMHVALELARRHLGQTWPNPSVGAVLVKEGRIIGQGITAKGGRPHAETEAITQATESTAGATLYVTLEPCAHQGQTPPCTTAIIAAGIRQVVIACRDPNPLVAGQGITQLQQAGIEVIEGICFSTAREVNQGFFSVIEQKRPFIALKIATSLDGKLATATGESKWVTGENARAYGQLLRSHFDAIATGIGTVLADDPLLTCRVPGREHCSPIRIIFDRQNRLPIGSQLAQTAKQVPVWPQNSSTIHDAVIHLAEKGITRLLVEAGPRLSTAFLQSGMVDRIYWFRAPLVVGSEGLSSVGDDFSPIIAELPRWRSVERRFLQPDTLEIFECLPAS